MTRINSLYGSRNSPVDLYMQNKVIFLRNTSLCGTQPSSMVCKTATGFCMQNSDFSEGPRITSLYGSQCFASPVVLCIQNSDFSIRITSLYGSQPSFVAFACKTADFRCPNYQKKQCTSLYCPRPHLWFFAFKTATLAPELQISLHVFCMPAFRSRIISIGGFVHFTRIASLCGCHIIVHSLQRELIVSVGPRPLLSFCAWKTSWLAPELPASIGPRLHLSFCTCKTTWLSSELLVSMGPSRHMWFLHAKQRL